MLKDTESPVKITIPYRAPTPKRDRVRYNNNSLGYGHGHVLGYGHGTVRSF